MAAGYQDQYIEKGTDFTSQLTLKDSYGNPYNLSYFTVSSQARISYTSSNVALQFSSSIIDANNGIIQLSANSATTANIVPNYVGRLVYDVVITDSTGIKSRVLEGQITVSPSVTQ
jgi:hypothetical protein